MIARDGTCFGTRLGRIVGRDTAHCSRERGKRDDPLDENAAARLKEASLCRSYFAVIANDKRSAGDREGERLRGSKERKGWEGTERNRESERSTYSERNRMFTVRVIVSPVPLTTILRGQSKYHETSRYTERSPTRLIAHGAPTACHLILRDCIVDRL